MYKKKNMHTYMYIEDKSAVNLYILNVYNKYMEIIECYSEKKGVIKSLHFITRQSAIVQLSHILQYSYTND